MRYTPDTAKYYRELPYRLCKAVPYVLLSVIIYYCNCYRLPVGTKYAVNLVIIGWALLSFLIRPRLEDMKYCLQFFVLYSVTFIIPWVWSILIWIQELQSIGYIIRGSLNIFYMLTTMGCLCASFYLFKERSIAYVLIGMTIANGMVLLETCLKYSIPQMIREYFTLVFTFADKGGPAVGRMELHDIVFGWGSMLIHYLICPMAQKKNKWSAVIVSAFFFTLSFKRISILAFAMAMAAAIVYRRLSERKQIAFLRLCAFLYAVGSFAYIYMVRSGLFYEIMDLMNVNLMGRKEIFSAYEDFYEITPFFMGRGSRFVYHYGTTVNGVETLHNDLLGLYIEIGFVMWFVWMWYEFYFRAKYLGQKYGYAAATSLIAHCVYMYIVFMTDNTFYYYPSNFVYRLSTMIWCWNVYQKKDGYEPPAPKKKKKKRRTLYSSRFVYPARS